MTETFNYLNDEFPLNQLLEKQSIFHDESWFLVLLYWYINKGAFPFAKMMLVDSPSPWCAIGGSFVWLGFGFTMK